MLTEIPNVGLRVGSLGSRQLSENALSRALANYRQR
jgi:hypothetical protein